MNELRQLAEVIEPPVRLDPDDDHVLALALAARVGLIVSGDDDLLALGNYQGIPIISPAQAVQKVNA